MFAEKCPNRGRRLHPRPRKGGKMPWPSNFSFLVMACWNKGERGKTFQTGEEETRSFSRDKRRPFKIRTFIFMILGRNSLLLLPLCTYGVFSHAGRRRITSSRQEYLLFPLLPTPIFCAIFPRSQKTERREGEGGQRRDKEKAHLLPM